MHITIEVTGNNKGGKTAVVSLISSLLEGLGLSVEVENDGDGRYQDLMANEILRGIKPAVVVRERSIRPL